MSLTFGFYNGSNHDRKYSAKQISDLFNGLIGDGVFASIGTSLVVAASSGMTVNVGIGRAWFNGTWTDNDALLPLVIPTSEVTLDRIDAVVLEVDESVSVRANSIKIIKGTPGASPSNPTLTNTSTVHQYPLAYIAVGHGVTEILGSNITSTVGTAPCPFVTGIIQTITIEGVTNTLESEFNQWFDAMKDQLTEDAAGNLQTQINTLTGEVATKHEDVVGEVLTTVRTDLGPTWVLCNGEKIDAAQYPALYEILMNNFHLESSILPTVTSKQFNIAYNGTTYVFQVSGGGSSKINYYTATSLEGPWTSNLSPTVYATGTTLYGNNVGYETIWDGTRFVFEICGQRSGYTDWYSKIVYTADFVTWGDTVIYGGYSAATLYIHGLTYDSQAGTYAIIVWPSAIAATYLYSATSITGPFTQTCALGNINEYITRIKKVNGYFIMLYISGSGVYLRYATGLTGDFTQVTVASSQAGANNASQYHNFMDIDYINGKFVILYTLLNTQYTVKLAYCSTIDGTYTKIILMDYITTVLSGVTLCAVDGVGYGICGRYGFIIHTETDIEVLDLRELFEYEYIPASYFPFTMCGDTPVTVLRISVYGTFIFSICKVLPMISEFAGYTYIKASEGA